ncbi:MAG: hypothetical protein DRJ13_07625 [Bacteroidetes bacterium]|nr:MAG: hypothetical protein DRJ13_07625 [Bacteroidota bacterium]
MGIKEKEKVRLGKQTFSPQQISGMFLKEIKKLAEEELGEEVTGAVITCPAYFKDPQRNAIREAGQIAGINVLSILNEPTAAAYAYVVAQEIEDKENLFIVYDLGGGTFDVTVISSIAGQLEVLGTGGDPNLGGGDFDDCIVEWMLDRIKEIYPEYHASLDKEMLKVLRIKLKSYAEDAKKALCGPPLEEYKFTLASIDRFEGLPLPFEEVLTMKEFESMINALVDKSMESIDTAMEVPKSKTYNYTEDDITEILLVGGSTRVPLIRKKLSERFPGKPLRGPESGINPDEIVAMGAAIKASEHDPDNTEVLDHSMVDVTGHSLSVAVYDDDEKKMVLSIIIHKETPIPIDASHSFRSHGEGQSQVNIKVYQGEAKYPEDKDAMMIGEYLMEIDPIKKPTPLLVGLQIDEDGILIATATNKNNGNMVTCEINYDDSTQMSPEDLKKKQAALEATLQGQVGSTENPLDAKGGNGASSNVSTTAPPPPGTKVTQAAESGNMTSVAEQMNPVVRNLYKKAIENFDEIPDKSKIEVMQIVGEMELAARNGDQSRLMELYTPLNQIIDKL